MRKILAFVTVFFLLFVGFSNATPVTNGKYIDTDNEPDVVKKQLLIESSKITDIGMQVAKETLELAFFENITEADVVRAATDGMIAQGSSEYIEAFGVIVASGEQSALAHGDASDDEVNQILIGEVVVVDLGARYRGYCTDQTRTFFMGPPTEEMMHIYNITLEAQEASFKAVQAGALARDVDKVARDIISNYGYGENFTHGLGHGIGVNVHMPPTLAPNSYGVLFQTTDMAITIEPGIYLPGNYGVRIEDDVMVTRTGYELITHSPKELEDAIICPEGFFNASEDAGESPTKQSQNTNYFMLLGLLITICALVVVLILFKKYKIKNK